MTVADLKVLIESAVKSTVKFPEVSWARKAPTTQIRDILQRIINIYVKNRLDLEIKGQEHLYGLSLPAIFAANPLGPLDTFAILRALPPNVRGRIAAAAAADIYFGINRDMEMSFARKTLVALTPLVINVFPFSRTVSVRKSLGLLGELLDDGWSVLIFPEGATSPNGEMLPFRPGIGMIAEEMLVLIVPVKLKGSFDIFPGRKVFPLKSKAEVCFGKPLSFKGENDYPSIAREIENALRAL